MPAIYRPRQGYFFKGREGEETEEDNGPETYSYVNLQYFIDNQRR